MSDTDEAQRFRDLFEAAKARSQGATAFRCRLCKRPAPQEWGTDRRCPEAPTDRPPWMRSCEFEPVSVPSGVPGEGQR